MQIRKSLFKVTVKENIRIAKGRSRGEDSANGKLRVEWGLRSVPLNSILEYWEM